MIGGRFGSLLAMAALAALGAHAELPPKLPPMYERGIGRVSDGTSSLNGSRRAGNGAVKAKRAARKARNVLRNKRAHRG